MKKMLLVLFTLLLLTGCKKAVLEGIESSVYEEDNVQNIKITNQRTPIRSGCSNNEDVLETANQNDQYKVINKVDDWYAVQLPDNSIGFIPQDQCKAVVDESQPIDVTNNTEITPAQQQVAVNEQQENKNTTASDTNKADKDNAVNNSEISEDEQTMLDLVNQERAANGLNPLEADTEVTNVARVKSQDMIDNNYFSHNSPTYGSPFDMLKSFSVHYVAAGENIAGNQTVQAAHDALMNSPGHRANILKGEYTHVGIGIIDGGPYGKMFTQIFVSKPQ